MKLLVTTLICVICFSCASESYLQSNQLVVSGLVEYSDSLLVQVKGLDNANKPIYASFISRDKNYQIGDTLWLR